MREEEKQLAPIEKLDVTQYSEEEYDLLFNSKVGMKDVKELEFNFPQELSIIQDTTSDDLFEDPELNDRKAKGKIYVKPQREKNPITNKWENSSKLKKEDLREIFRATLLKVETGVEIYEELKVNPETGEKYKFPMKKVLCRNGFSIDPAESEIWKNEHSGLNYSNQTRLILTPLLPFEIEKVIEQGRNPFFTVTLKGGSGWATMKKIRKEMTEIKKKLGIKTFLSSILPSLFCLDLFTQKVDQYYLFNVTANLNDPKRALEYQNLVDQFAGFTFFTNTKSMNPELRKSSYQLEDETLEETASYEGEIVKQENIKSIEKIVEDKEEEEIGEDDLPF